jgi:hypothetical protein
MRFYSSFVLVMRKSDQRKNEMCGLLTSPTKKQTLYQRAMGARLDGRGYTTK